MTKYVKIMNSAQLDSYLQREAPVPCKSQQPRNPEVHGRTGFSPWVASSKERKKDGPVQSEVEKS